MPGGAQEAPFLAQIMAAAGVDSRKITYLGSGQWDDPAIARESTLNGALYPAPDNTGFAGFAQRYQSTFGATPSRTATLAYDAVSLAAGLTARFGNQRFSQQTLTNPSGYIGLDGAFRFLANGLNQRSLAVYQVNNGQAVLVDPAPKTFAQRSGT